MDLRLRQIDAQSLYSTSMALVVSSSTMLNLWKRLKRAVRAGGIRRRLLIWGLSLFGVALTIVVVVSYSYTRSQIEKDATQLQSEIATVTADRIRNFVRRKIERFSDTAAAVTLYPLGSKEQELLMRLLVKNDNSFTDASIMNA